MQADFTPKGNSEKPISKLKSIWHQKNVQMECGETKTQKQFTVIQRLIEISRAAISNWIERWNSHHHTQHSKS